VIDKTGSLAGIKRHDFCPFGEELSAGIGIRSAALGYGADSTRQKFTSKERDAETGLDYFLARYFSSVQGRFTSPDEFKGGPDELWVLGSGDPEKQALVYADITNPQSLNKYQYCFNNPLRYVDPDGHDPQDGGAGRAEERLTQAYFQGKISREEYERQRQELFKAQAIGAGVGLAILGAIYSGPSAWAAIGLWAARNPGTAQRMAEEVVQMSSGNPGLTLSAKTGLRAAEIASGNRLAKQISGRLVESTHVGADFVDAVTKKTYDVMGTPNAYKHFGSGKEFFGSILHHVNKSVNHVAIDLKGASKQQVQAIQGYVSGLTKEQRDKIIYLSP
jgi:RHS repeat-associated protein